MEGKKISLEEMLYYALFSLLLFSKGIGLEEGSGLFRLCFLGAVCLFAAKILLGKYTLPELALMGGGLLWGGLLFLRMGSLGMFIYALLLFGMKNVPLARVMKVALGVWSACMLFTVTWGIFFDRPGVRLVHEKLGLGPLLRESLGYTHPNVLHISYILLMVLVLYHSKKEAAKKAVLLLLAGNFFIFLYSMSYTGLLSSAVVIVAYAYFLLRKKFSKGEELLIQAVLPMCLVVSIVCPLLLDGGGLAFRIVNGLLNNRVWAIKVFFTEYGITAFGESIQRQGFSLDNSFIYALGWYGAVFLAVMAAAYWLLIRKQVKENRRMELMIVLSFLIAGLTEQFLFNASIKNISILFLGEALYGFTRQKGRAFALASRWNRSFQVNTRLVSEWKDKIKALPWKKMGAAYMVINLLAFGLIYFLPLERPDRVYVNERLCDCEGELIEAGQIEKGENTLIIGDASEEALMYFFTQENSKLIEVMDIRYKISLSVYLSVMLAGAGGLLLSAKGTKKMASWRAK